MNFENTYKLRALTIEDKLYHFDQEIQQIKYFISRIESNAPIADILKKAQYFESFDELINNETDLKESLSGLNSKVSSSVTSLYRVKGKILSEVKAKD